MFCKRILESCAAALVLSVAGFAATADIADAVMKGDKAAVRTLLNQKADVNAPQTDGATALHWAVFRDDLETADLLIRAGANVSARNRPGMTPLSLAAVNGSAPMIGKLLAAGADANERLANGETALMMASRTGKVDAMKALIDRGADVNGVENLRGTTALMWASAQEHPAAVKFLIERGADMKVRSKAVPIGRGPYLAPTPKERIQQVAGGTQNFIQGEQPLAGGGSNQPAGVEVGGGGGGAVREISNKDDPNQAGGLTAMVFAARQGDLETVKVFVDAGADVNQVTQYGWSPLLAATKNGYYTVAKYLIEKGADVNLANKGGWTPLYLATDNRNIEGGDYPTRKPDIDHLEFMKYLLDKGANPNARMIDSTETRTIFTHQWLYEDGATALLRAAQSGDIALIRLLLQYGADPLVKTENGDTALMVASGIGWVEGVTRELSPAETFETVKLLLEKGSDVNAVNGELRNALHGAAHKGRNDVVQLLVDKGADLQANDIGSRDTAAGHLIGRTFIPLDYAEGLVRVGVQSAIPHPETAALLRKLMSEKGIPLPAVNRDPRSICITAACAPPANQ